MDTHKEFNEVAYYEEQREAVPMRYGRIPSSKVSIKKLIRQFESKYPGATLHVVYGAGPCGYWIYRLITSLGHCCYVGAPSLIPTEARSTPVMIIVSCYGIQCSMGGRGNCYDNAVVESFFGVLKRASQSS